MKKISNEVKVGAVALLTIVVFIWLFNYLKGKDYFKRTNYYYCVYNEVGGLSESSPVEVNGYKVGVVQSIDFLDETSGKLLVEFSVSKDFRLPVNTVAEIVPVSIIAGMKVQFIYGSGPGFYENGDTIRGTLSPSIITTIESEFRPVKVRIANLADALDSVITSIDEILTPQVKKDLEITVSNIRSATGSLNDVIGAEEKELRETLASINRFAVMLSRNSENMERAIVNLESVSDTLATADLYGTVTELKTNLENTSLLLSNLNEGKGSAGKILTNDSLYINLSSSLENLNLLLIDIKANPKKYLRFSVFGKK